MTREEYHEHVKANYLERYDLHDVMLAAWDAENGEPEEAAPASVEPDPAPEGDDV